ncbi:hypothetical protein F8S13_02990 [Chloroflexia bacterium SDU3-3]|nr:hypothetical protein F8S13_02990 [Chloroflexia bacterium SDU3-3]
MHGPQVLEARDPFRVRAIPGGQGTIECGYAATAYAIGCNPREYVRGTRIIDNDLDYLRSIGKSGKIFNPMSKYGRHHFAVRNEDGTITDPALFLNLDNARMSQSGLVKLPEWTDLYRGFDTFTEEEYQKLIDLWGSLL